MPRIKPPRNQEPPALATPPEPLPTDDVTFNLDEPAPNEPVEIALAPQEPDPPVVVTPEPPAPGDTLAEPPKHDDAVKRILEATQRADALQRQLAEAQRTSALREQELSRDRDDAQYNSILTAIAAEQSALDKAESDYVAFSAAGDWANAAKAQTIQAKAASRIDRLEDNKQAFEARREELKRQPSPQPAPAPAPQSVDQEINALGVPEEAKAYLRQHPELISDPAKRKRLGNIHNYIVDRVAAFSPDYFSTLDRELGYATTTEEPAPAPAPARRSMPVSAPVSRDVPTASGQRRSNQVTLTPQEREIARNSFGQIKDKNGNFVDLTNAEKERLYAMNKAKLQRLRASGEYRQTTEQTG